MDFIAELAGQLGIEPQEAKALAGGLMGMVQEATREQEGPETASALEDAIPEIEGWKDEAAAQADAPDEGTDVSGLLGDLFGGGNTASGLGDLLGAAGGWLGGSSGHAAQLAGLIAKLGIDPAKAQMLAPVALNFLKSRLSPELLQKILAVAPFLTRGDSGAGNGGSGGGLLSGFLR